jgi:hypothetical protein
MPVAGEFVRASSVAERRRGVVARRMMVGAEVTIRVRRWRMPIRDWTRVSAGGFLDFHQDWTIEIRRTLNRALLPAGDAAYTDERVNGYEPDVINVDAVGRATEGGLAVAEHRRKRVKSPARRRRRRRRSMRAERTGSPSATNLGKSRSSRSCHQGTRTASTPSRPS